MAGPLDGILVIDFTHVLAGPFCSSVLRDLGARIIKVEKPESGDDTRAFPPFIDGTSAYFAALNSGKESIALDLKTDDDRLIFEALLHRADILLENHRPGVMERLGYGWEQVCVTFPRLIYGAVSGFGHSGPDREKPAYDMVVQARGGVMSITGEEGGPPVRVGASIGDIVAGMYLAQGVLAALYARERTGKGDKIDIAMLDAQVAIQEHSIAITTATGQAPVRTGSRHPTITPFSTYRGSDGFFVIAAGNNVLFEKMYRAIGLDLAADERFRTNAGRCENVHVLKRLIEAITIERPAQYWIDLLSNAGVPTGRVQTMEEVIKDPQVQARNMILPLEADAKGRKFWAAGNPIKMMSLPERARRPHAPCLDENRQPLLDWLLVTKRQ